MLHLYLLWKLPDTGLLFSSKTDVAMNHFVAEAEQEVQDWLRKSDKCLNVVIL